MADNLAVKNDSKKTNSFDCKHCYQSFSNKTQLAKHMFLHRDGFICPYCSKQFASESGLKRHWNANHKNAKPTPQCDICGEKFNLRRDLEKHHLLSHRADKHFKCKFCGAKFSWITNLKKHESFHTNETNTSTNTTSNETPKEKENKLEPPAIYQCQICNKTFNYDFTYAIHIEGHNSSLSQNNSRSSVNEQKNEKSSIPVEVIIEVLPSEDPNKSQAIVSIETMPENQQEQKVDPVQENSSNLVEKILNHEENRELFQFLKGHKQRRDEQMRRKLKKKQESAIYGCVMTEEKPFKCKICGEAFRWEISLGVHEELHTKGKTLKIRKPYVKHKKGDTAKSKEVTTPAKPRYHKNKYKIIYQKESDEDNDDECYDDDDDELCKSIFSDDKTEDEENGPSPKKKLLAVSNNKLKNQNVTITTDDSPTANNNVAIANAEKFTKKLSKLLIGTKNSFQKSEALTQKDIVGQLVLLDSLDGNLSLDGGKVVSTDGTHYIINNGFLYPINDEDGNNLLSSGNNDNLDLSKSDENDKINENESNDLNGDGVANSDNITEAQVTYTSLGINSKDFFKVSGDQSNDPSAKTNVEENVEEPVLLSIVTFK